MDPTHVPLQRVDVSWAVTAVSGTHVCLRKVEPARIWELFEDEKITHYCAAPTVQIGIVNEESGHRLQTPVTAAIAGAPPSPTLLGGLIELNIRPMHIYGLTETYGPMTTSGVHPEWEELEMDERARLWPGRVRALRYRRPRACG